MSFSVYLLVIYILFCNEEVQKFNDRVQEVQDIMFSNYIQCLSSGMARNI